MLSQLVRELPTNYLCFNFGPLSPTASALQHKQFQAGGSRSLVCHLWHLVQSFRAVLCEGTFWSQSDWTESPSSMVCLFWRSVAGNLKTVKQPRYCSRDYVSAMSLCKALWLTPLLLPSHVLKTLPLLMFLKLSIWGIYNMKNVRAAVRGNVPLWSTFLPPRAANSSA